MAGESGPVLSLTSLRDAPADPATSVLQGRRSPRPRGTNHVIDGLVDDPEWRMGLSGYVVGGWCLRARLRKVAICARVTAWLGQ